MGVHSAYIRHCLLYECHYRKSAARAQSSKLYIVTDETTRRKRLWKYKRGDFGTNQRTENLWFWTVRGSWLRTCEYVIITRWKFRWYSDRLHVSGNIQKGANWYVTNKNKTVWKWEYEKGSAENSERWIDLFLQWLW